MDAFIRTDEKVRTSTKWFFALGDIFQGGYFNIVNFFYSIFLTDVVGLNPIWAANVFLLGKIWDAVIDPGMGMISDNTRTRFGRRRPFFLIGAPLILFAFMMMWHPLQADSETSKIVFFIFAYMLMNTASAIVSVPFLAMSAELSTDYNERTSITNIRMIVSIISSIVCAVAPMLIVGMHEDIRSGYIMMSLIFGLFFALPLLLVFFKVPERKQFSEGKKGSFKEMFATLRLRAFRQFVFMYLCIVIAMDIISMIFAYYMTYNLGRAGELSFVLGVLLIAEVASVPLASSFAKKQSKARAIIFGNAGWICCALCSTLIGKESPGFAIYVLAAVLGFFIAFSLIGFTAMFGDVTEVGEYHFGRRIEGSFTGIQQFIRKCAAALANWIALMLLGLSGFVNPVESVVGGVTTMITQPQSDTVLFTIKGILAFSSVILLLPAIIAAVRWKLTKEKHAALINYLDRKRSGASIAPEEETEVEEMLKPLI
ncbi:MAG: glycoside-pentoside-hexuronide (GPH):cation symporter [Clostridiales bacterium]|nr:glycoside-pentoside-hexuronide (GPH):cation symporter [Clostridiales bacterium]